MSGPQAVKLAVATALVAVLAGCGHQQVIGGGRTLYLGLTEYRLIPQSVSVSAGGLTVFVHNYGRLTHNLVVSLDGQSAGSTRPISPGGSAELALILGPGTYTMSSTILSDQTLGAYGTLRVTS
jgi:hypothetical protein